MMAHVETVKDIIAYGYEKLEPMHRMEPESLSLSQQIIDRYIEKKREAKRFAGRALYDYLLYSTQ